MLPLNNLINMVTHHVSIGFNWKKQQCFFVPSPLSKRRETDQPDWPNAPTPWGWMFRLQNICLNMIITLQFFTYIYEYDIKKSTVNDVI